MTKVVLFCLFLPDCHVLRAPRLGCVNSRVPVGGLCLTAVFSVLRGWVLSKRRDTREGEVCRLATMSAIGSIEPFAPEAELITAYMERIQLYFCANAIARDCHVPLLRRAFGVSLLRKEGSEVWWFSPATKFPAQSTSIGS